MQLVVVLASVVFISLFCEVHCGFVWFRFNDVNSCFFLFSIEFFSRQEYHRLHLICSYQLYLDEMIFGLSSTKKKDSMKHTFHSIVFFFFKNVSRFINLLNYITPPKGSNNKGIAFFIDR